MSAAKTLLQLSGADLRPPALAHATLLIIDAQNEYLDGMLALPGVTRRWLPCKSSWPRRAKSVHR
jgi:hypothetical protein